MSHFDTIGPIATLTDCAKQIGISNQALHERLNRYPQLTRPNTFRAAGAPVMTTDNARIWVDEHLAQWEAVKASKDWKDRSKDAQK